jgi:hypothetical protein
VIEEIKEGTTDKSCHPADNEPYNTYFSVQERTEDTLDS